jgi:hypothetical protein
VKAMNWYRNLKPWQQGLIGVATFLVGTYLVTWVFGPYSEYLDNVRCGIDNLFGRDCTYRFTP